MRTALICLWAWSVVMTGISGYLCLTVSRMSRKDTPTPSTRPVEPISEVMTMMSSMMTTFLDTMERQVTTLVLGREQPPQTLQMVTPPMPNGKAIDYDDDSIPLSPGIQAAMGREAEETEHQRFLRERSVLQSRITDLLQEAERMDLDDSTGFSPRHLAEERGAPSPGSA